jgi:hypothetical protein
MFETHASIVIPTLHVVKDFQWHEGIALPILLYIVKDFGSFEGIPKKPLTFT